MKKYHYSPLTLTRQVRLLKVYAGAEADELSSELVHTSLDTTPSFIALSYAWGHSKHRKSIRCSGLTVEIGPSLHSALQHLRQPAREVLLWADALCINQEDILERSQQLSGLARSRTRPDEAKMAFDLLHKFSVAWDSLNCDPPASNDSDFISRNRAEKTLQAAFGENRAAAFGHIWALLNRPWFTRKWVIQELPLEPNAKVLGMSMLRATLLTRIAVPEKQLLLHLIVKTLEFRCADFRDHVFAMVGIASDADTFDLIDYGSPIEKVCQKLAYACVSDSMNLKLLWSLVYLAPLKRRSTTGFPVVRPVLSTGPPLIAEGGLDVEGGRHAEQRP
ncbi:uncharacterized protein RCO7_11500 [Rhynchosporium graminicola]|uniref:Heterokaryon incompatibility domain-containing protein n=1 Tax=Rhynchosporium graminicola TaxID=2792576 RepID=A0A1E1KRJ1_9HELO|nr:uncharacterized protein RCO7_11500 [Rhynchosporium commune]